MKKIGQQLKQLDQLIDNCKQYRKLCQSIGVKKDSPYTKTLEQITQTAKVANKAKRELEVTNQVAIIKDIEKKSKRVKKKVTKNLKKQRITDMDLDRVQEVLKLIDNLSGFYQTATDFLKEKFKKKYERIKTGLLPQLQQLYQKVKDQAPSQQVDNEDTLSFNKFVEEVERQIQIQKQNLEKIQKEMEKVVPKDIPSGTALISVLD